MSNIYKVTAEEVWKVRWLVEADTPAEASDKAHCDQVQMRVMHSFDRYLDPDGMWHTELHVGKEEADKGDINAT